MGRSRSRLSAVLDESSKIFVIVAGSAMIWISYHFSTITEQISKIGVESEEVRRKSDILPRLEVVNYLVASKGSLRVTVPFRNVGLGTAFNLRAKVFYDGKFGGDIERIFTPLKDTPLGTSYLYDPTSKIPGITIPPPKFERDWIRPEEVLLLTFRLHSPKDGKASWGTTYTIFFSYFDLDGNEHLTISKTTDNPFTGWSFFMSGEGFSDSLMSMAEKVKPQTSRTFDNVNIRTSNEGF